ncbi:MAG: ATP-binding protein [Acidobacteriota bacterium]
MRRFSSLRSRIFLASAVLAVLSIGVALFVVNGRVTREAERTLQRQVEATGTLVDQLSTARTHLFTAMAQLVADSPTIKSSVDTNDPPTVQNVADGYQRQLNSNLLLVTHKSGRVLAIVGASVQTAMMVASQPEVRGALTGRESVSLLSQANGVLQLVTVPIAIGLTRPEILGTLSIGFLIDDAVAAQLKAMTGSDVAFGMNGQVLAATLPPENRPELAALLRPGSLHQARIGHADYVVLQQRLSEPTEGESQAGPVALILRSRTEELAGLKAIQTALGVTAVVAVILATLLSFGVARTITRPLAAITDAMRDVASTGDLTRRISLQPRPWDDEDARLLAATFNTLTESVARFQHEISQKERLSSLGRLSTVIAHEIRNPLMIIKASVRTLRRPDADTASVREAVTDIDDEVGRLNRIVNEVLDFSRPIRFELASTDVNAVCAQSTAAAQASRAGAAIHLDLAPVLPRVMTDAERLRIALVNMLVNARHAVLAREESAATANEAGVHPQEQSGPPSGARRSGSSPPAAAAPAITLRTAWREGRVAIVIEDRGIGIGPDDLSRMFDPYFTTKRGGTGLGLAIAKNIIEGLRGTIAVTSVPGVGTTIAIDLPADESAFGQQKQRAG